MEVDRRGKVPVWGVEWGCASQGRKQCCLLRREYGGIRCTGLVEFSALTMVFGVEIAGD
jgi:hypothetical protein